MSHTGKISQEDEYVESCEENTGMFGVRYTKNKKMAATFEDVLFVQKLALRFLGCIDCETDIPCVCAAEIIENEYSFGTHYTKKDSKNIEKTVIEETRVVYKDEWKKFLAWTNDEASTCQN